jgi:hypothetical protein
MAPQSSPPNNIKTTDGRTGSTQAIPDNRLLVSLDDGRSFVIDSERLAPQGDGTYLLSLTAADADARHGRGSQAS